MANKPRKPLGSVGRTERGFELIEFEDFNRKSASLQQSSLALYEPPGSSALWLGLGDMRMHLDDCQVRSLVAHLHAWLDNGSLVLPPETP